MTHITLDYTTGTVVDQDNQQVDTLSLLDAFKDYAHFESGLLPPGVLSIRQGGGLTQLAIQIRPGIYQTNWHHDSHKEIKAYQLAMPWRVVLGTFTEKNHLLGIRVFYSPKPITSYEDILYHTNLPNVNCRGYGDKDNQTNTDSNAVGWLCLYPEGLECLSIRDKFLYMIDRVSGFGSYNDYNMNETDGTRFYQEYLNDKDFLYDPLCWQKKSLEEGFSFMLEEENLLQVKVKDTNNQGRHDKDGIPLTLNMALTGNARWHYSEYSSYLKMFNAIVPPEKDPYYLQVKMVKTILNRIRNRKPFDFKSFGLEIEEPKK